MTKTVKCQVFIAKNYIENTVLTYIRRQNDTHGVSGVKENITERSEALH